MKRILLSSITMLYWATTHAQLESTINVPYTASASPTYKALVYLPSDYSTTTKSYPLLVFCHSASEAADGASTGTGLAKIYNQASYGGPAYFIEHGGWPASFSNPVNGAQEQFIVVSPQASTWSISGDQLANIVNYLVATYRVDVNRIHLTGVSAGGAGVAEYAAQLDPNEDAPSLTKDARKYKPADIVPMSQASNDPTQTWGNIDVSDSIPLWGFGDANHDLYGGFVQDFSTVINKAKSGYARFTSFTTGHGPWNPFYNPGYTENFTWRSIKTNYSIYSWMLGNSRIPIPVVPVANAGTAQTISLPVNTVTLNGSGSTGNITSYSWTQLSGPAGDTIKSPTAVSTMVTGLAQGVYVFQLAVTGGSTSTVQITVNAAPPPPVANAGAPQTITLPTSQVTLSGSGSTGTITAYAWTQVSGPSMATIATPTTVSTRVSALVQGVYLFQLTLNGGSRSTVQVTVNPPPLVANAGSSQSITLPTNNVTLSASASTGAIVSYSWRQLIGPLSDTIKSPGASSTQITGLVAGTYTFQLTLTDDTGAVATSTVDVQVLSNTPYASPIVTLSPASQTITLPTTSINVNMNPVVTGSSLNSVKWTKFKAPGQTPKTVVFMGSSSTAGVGASVPDSSFVGRFTRYYAAQGLTANVVNLSVSGYNPYNAMPTGYVAPASVVNALGASNAAVDPAINVTKALSLGPDLIVINFPNNGYDVLGTSDVMNGLQLLYNAAAANGAQVYITTTQPREDFSASVQSKLQALRDSILLRFGSRAMDFYDPIVVPGTTKRLYPSSADNVHDNDQGHRQLFNVLAGTNIFQNLINSAATIAAPGSAGTVINGLTQGTNLFQATVTDGHGQQISAVATVTVNGVPALAANAGPAQTIVLPTSQAMLNGSASTGAITSYAWTQVSGPDGDTIVSPSSDSTLVTGLVQGEYVFQLTVNGDSSATVQVTVTPPPPLVADAGANQAIVWPANQTTLNGSGSSGPLTSYLWTQLSGPASDTLVTPSAATTVVKGLIQGTYLFQLTVTDNLGTTSTDTITVTVNSGTVSKMINVNLYGGTSPYTNTQWNNWNVNSGVTSPTLTYSDGTSSGATAGLSVNESVVDNGASYGGTMAPAAVLRFTSYCETTRTLTLNGLKTAATYTIELYASRNSNPGQKSVFAIARQASDTVLSFNNLNNKAVFSGVKANSSGKIVITISTPTGYNYLNGFAVTELTSSTGSTGGTVRDPVGAYAANFGGSDSALGAPGDLIIYPNPAGEQVTLRLNNAHVGPLKIMILDGRGKPLRRWESRKEGQVSSNQVPVNGLAPGSYLL
ncbi:MAG: hypothetical protein Q8932_17890, partial [Bacteroidota bacterium]|nr:hypothetical protein [Bacteroidota bacterium]